MSEIGYPREIAESLIRISRDSSDGKKVNIEELLEKGVLVRGDLTE